MVLNSSVGSGRPVRPQIVPEKRIYNVSIRRVSAPTMALRISLAFAIMTAWLGLTRVWFGGSWVTDVFALVVAIAMVAGIAKRQGSYVTMTQAEMRRWLDAGCPDTWPGKQDQPDA